MIYLVADLHIGHKNIIKYDKRPDVDIESMNRRIIDTTNDLVGENDILINLGDLILDHSIDKDDNATYVARVKEVLGQLLCRSHIYICGNHDRTWLIKNGDQVPNFPFWQCFQTRFQCLEHGRLFSPTGTFRLPRQCSKSCSAIQPLWDIHPMGYELKCTPKLCADHGLPREMNHLWIALTHYALRVWRGSHRGKTWALFGHSHGSLPGMHNSFDVGFNGWNRPLSLLEIFTDLMPKNNALHTDITPHH